LGTSKLFGSYGRYYETFEAQIGGVFQGNHFRVEYDHDPRFDPSGADTTQSGENASASVIDVSEGQYFDEFVVGYERDLQGLFKLSASGVYRRLGNAIEDSFVPEEEWFIRGNPGQGILNFMEKPRRDYTALVLSIERFGPGPVQAMCSYVLSENYGNFTGALASDLRAELTNGRGSFAYDFPEQLVNGTGPLPNDRRHALRLYGSYRFGFGLTAGTWFSWLSGTPLSEYGALQHPWADPVLNYSFIRQRGTAGRMPSLFDLNLRITYALKQRWGSPVRPRLVLDLLHVLNRRTAVDFDQKHYYGVDPDGNPTDENPFYGQPIAFQPPMSARLGLLLDF
jgi:hypothetical protein